MVLLLTLLVTGCASTVAPLAPASAAKQPAITAMPSPSIEQARQEDLAIAAVDLDKSIFFASGEAEIDARGKLLLQQHAEYLKANPKQKVLLVGYTDDRGSSAYNIAVADMRVSAVFKALREHGVAIKQLRRYSAGGEKNSNACRSDECRRLMRRVELNYDPK